MDDWLITLRRLLRSQPVDEKAISEELAKMMSDADRRAFGGRLERLRALLFSDDLESFGADALAFEYYHEARLCWYMGAFVATIVMTQLAFEELLRSYYRVARGVHGSLRAGMKVDDASFAALVEQAKADGLVQTEEASALHKLRKEHRNPYVHTRDFVDESRAFFMGQLHKIWAAQQASSGVGIEAQESITLLARLFPAISRRLWSARIEEIKNDVG